MFDSLSEKDLCERYRQTKPSATPSACLIAPRRMRCACSMSRAQKNRKAIKQALADLRESNDAGGSAVELQSLIEQCCNFYLQQGRFPASYEELQPIPLQKRGILPYAADDGGELGQAYHLRLDPEKRELCFAFRFPDAAGR